MVLKLFKNIFYLKQFKNKNMINVGIIGGSGYTAELIRILMFHNTNAKLDFVCTTNAGNRYQWRIMIYGRY
jgi:hypothetical protein